MHTLSKPEQWRTFLYQYAELYAQAAITAVQRNQDEQARSLVTSFARIAGGTTIAEYITTYENSIPTTGEDISEDERRANNELLKRLRQLRKGL
jgi:predicted solute-binding protein